MDKETFGGFVMPIHVYKCDVCGECREMYFHLQEQVVEEIKCTQCNGTCKRMISSPAKVEFKGKGFHVNDYPKS